MNRTWTSVWILAAVCLMHVHAHVTFSSRCRCGGRSQFCLRDAGGLRCVGCRGNSEGRHCERCRDGFYQQGAEPSCMPCGCNPAGSAVPACDGVGRCNCKDGVSGLKCDRCPDGPVGLDGCSPSRQPREDSGSLTPPCFCYGHSSQCSWRSGYSAYNITSTFATGAEGWTVTMGGGVAADNVHFRWSPRHQDLEVISRQDPPTYLSAPASFLGNQLLSFGQNLSFSLRLDRGVRYPSTDDVMLEGGGLRVTASLGDLSAVVSCGQKIGYSFRLDPRPGAPWRPQLSSSQFQTLLQNLTAVRIRATFGATGRGYLDDVVLSSARPGAGAPAGWVRPCDCPRGYEGEFCQRCSAGFRRRDPARGPFGTCEPGCEGGDCLWADQTPAERRCPPGQYRDPGGPRACARCPCPGGGSCSLVPGSREPVCDGCPACFGPVRVQMDEHAAQLQQLQTRITDAAAAPGHAANMAAALGALEQLVKNLQDDGERLAGTEHRLRARLSAVSGAQLDGGRGLRDAAAAADDIRRRQETHETEVEDIGTLVEDMRRRLEETRRWLGAADPPLRDAGPDLLSSLALTAVTLADKHRTEAGAAQEAAATALEDSETGLRLVQALAGRQAGVTGLMGDLTALYDGAAAQVKGLEGGASRLSEEAGQESKMAAGVLREASKEERQVPPPLQVPAAMATRLGGLQEALEEEVTDAREHQDAAQPRKMAAEALLADGRAAQQDLSRLLDRVTGAKTGVQDTLRRIGSDAAELDSALRVLRGFGQQLDDSRAQAAAAARRLPAVGATVQRAVGSNGETQSLLEEASRGYGGALGATDALEGLVAGLEHATGPASSWSGAVGEAAGLNQEAKELRRRAAAATRDLAGALEDGGRLEGDAQQAAGDAQEVLQGALETRVAMATTLQEVMELLESIRSTEVVDEEQLTRLEAALASAQKEVESQLRPRLRDMEAEEAGRRRQLARVERDVDALLEDVSNLEDILASVPAGCFNSPPIEEA